jgi:hypothetical protein
VAAAESGASGFDEDDVATDDRHRVLLVVSGNYKPRARPTISFMISLVPP